MHFCYISNALDNTYGAHDVIFNQIFRKTNQTDNTSTSWKNLSTNYICKCLWQNLETSLRLLAFIAIKSWEEKDSWYWPGATCQCRLNEAIPRHQALLLSSLGCSGIPWIRLLHGNRSNKGTNTGMWFISADTTFLKQKNASSILAHVEVHITAEYNDSFKTCLFVSN